MTREEKIALFCKKAREYVEYQSCSTYMQEKATKKFKELMKLKQEIYEDK